MNSELIKELKHIKETLVAREMAGEEWEERQKIIEDLENAVTYLNDASAKGIEFDD